MSTVRNIPVSYETEGLFRVAYESIVEAVDAVEQLSRRKVTPLESREDDVAFLISVMLLKVSGIEEELLSIAQCLQPQESSV